MCLLHRCPGATSTLWLTSLSNQASDLINLFDLRPANHQQRHHRHYRQSLQFQEDRNLSLRREEEEYLERKLFDKFIKWLNSSDEEKRGSRVRHLMREAANYLTRVMGMNQVDRNEEQDADEIRWEDDRLMLRQQLEQDNNLSLQVIGGVAGLITTTNPAHLDFIIQNEQVKSRLLEILRRARLYNGTLFVCHLALITTTVRQKYLSIAEPKLLSSSEIATRHFLWCLTILMVSLFDLINNLHWRHARESFSIHPRPDGKLRFRENRQSSWFKSLFLLLVSPGQLLQMGYVSLLISMSSSTSTGDQIVVVYNSLYLMFRHLYNSHRTHRYMEYIERHGTPHRIPVLNPEEDNNYTIANNIDMTSTRFLGRGWSAWPVRLWTSDREFRDSSEYRFEWLQMVLQMFGVKVTIFRLLLYLDGIDPIRAACSSYLLLGCLLAAFLAMHLHYDKFYSRYMNKQRNTC